MMMVMMMVVMLLLMLMMMIVMPIQADAARVADGDQADSCRFSCARAFKVLGVHLHQLSDQELLELCRTLHARVLVRGTDRGLQCLRLRLRLRLRLLLMMMMMLMVFTTLRFLNRERLAPHTTHGHILRRVAIRLVMRGRCVALGAHEHDLLLVRRQQVRAHDVDSILGDGRRRFRDSPF
uniref:Secreted protein n=1 Tax=Chrysotila carterae TaxID=13221 RepID=A0A7S4BI60_CHRCT